MSLLSPIVLIGALLGWSGPAPQAESDPDPASETRAPAVAPERVEVPPPRFRTYEDDPIEVKEVVLDNGLTVLLSEYHERPEVFGAVVVRTGGANDPADNTGMAHYLEHMLFKGTTELGTSDWAAEKPLMDEITRLYDELASAKTEEQRAKLQAQIGKTVEKTYQYAIPNELDKMLAEIGGTGINAFTTEDETVYHNSFPASQIDAWLDIYAHRFSDPVFRLFPTELEAVYEEKNISMDRFEVKLFESFMQKAFPEHPYGTQQVIGEVEHLKRPSLTVMRDYFDRYYVPNNMALVLAGDFEADAILPAIEQHFGTWQRGPDPEAGTGTVDPFDGREQFNVRLTPLRAGAFGFRTVPFGHEDYAALAVVRELLYNDQSSGYLDELIENGDLLIVFPFPQELAAHGLDLIFYAPKILGQSFRRAEKLVLEQYHRIGRGDFDEEQMRAVRDSLRLQADLGWEDNESRGLAMSDVFVRGLSWQDHLDYLDRLSKLTREDVMRVARTYYGDDFLLMRSRMGFPRKTRLEKPHYPSVKPKSGTSSKFYRASKERAQPEPRVTFVDFEGDVERTQIRPGVVLQRNPNPLNDSYSLELRFGVGTDAIPELGVLAGYLTTLGTTEHDAEAFKRELFLLNTTVFAEATPERFVLYVDGPEKNLGPALELVDELMQRPVPDERRLRQLRREMWGLERVNRRDPGYVASALNEFALHGDNSAFLRSVGLRAMRKLSPADVLATWKEAQAHEVELRYVGQQSGAAVADLVGSTLSFSEQLAPAKDKVVYDRVLPDEPTVFFLPRRDAIQSHLYFAVDGQPVPVEQQAQADAYDEYMGGSMAGLVFQEIREFRALAYSANARLRRDPTAEQSAYLTGYIGCQADKTFESIDVMLDLIQNLPQKPERLAALKGALVHSQETRTPSFRELQDRIEQWRWYGYTSDPRRELLPAYRELSFDDIEAIHERQIAGRPVALIVVGDPRKVDTKRLAKYGRVVKVRERDIFPR